MAILKYTDAHGIEHTINPYKVVNVIVQQEKGDSELDVMSQKAVTDALNELETRIEDVDANVDETFTNYYTVDEVDAQHEQMRGEISTEIENAVKTETERAEAVEQKMQEDLSALRTDWEHSLEDAAKALDEKVSWSDGYHNKIALPNHGQIVGIPNYDELAGKYPELGNASLLMLSKWNVTDVGSAKYPINLNGAKVRPTYNDDNELALLKDVQDLEAKANDGLAAFKDEVDNRFDKDEALLLDLDMREKKDVENIEAELDKINQDLNILSANHDSDVLELEGEIEAEATRAKEQEQAIYETLKLYVNDAKYDKEQKRINFMHDETVLAWIDAADFVRDGMVKNVEIVDRKLVITFNVDAGIANIEIPLDDIFNPNNYYTKDEVNAKVVNINSAMFQLKSDLETAISNLETKHNTEVADIKDSIEDIEADIESMKRKEDSDVTNLQNQIDAVNTTHANDKAELENAISDVITRIDNTDADVADINENIETIEANIVEVETEIEALKAKDATLEQSISDVNDRVNNSDTLIANEIIRATTEENAIRESLKELINDAKYDKYNKRINFLHGETVIAWIDATDFIKDGMVSSVKIVDGYLVIQFNTDAETEPITIKLSDIFNPDNYYTKEQVDEKVTVIETRVTTLEQEDVYITGQINGIKENVENLREDVSHIHDDIRVMQQDITSLMNSSDTYKENIKDLQKEVEKIEPLTERVVAIENDNVEIKKEQAKLERDNENINTEIGNVKADISNINTNISHINDDIDDINSKIRNTVDKGQYKQDMALVETKLHAEQTYATKEEMATKILELQTQINALVEKITWYENA